jgi:hypothetical protein
VMVFFQQWWLACNVFASCATTSILLI